MATLDTTRELLMILQQLTYRLGMAIAHSVFHTAKETRHQFIKKKLYYVWMFAVSESLPLRTVILKVKGSSPGSNNIQNY